MCNHHAESWDYAFCAGEKKSCVQPVFLETLTKQIIIIRDAILTEVQSGDWKYYFGCGEAAPIHAQKELSYEQ